MGYIDYKCKNCGANININDSKTAYCEFCGSQVVREDKSAREYYGNAIEKFSSESDVLRLDAVTHALIFNPDNDDLLFMKAILLKDVEILSFIVKDKITQRVKQACEEEFLKWNAIINYTVPLEKLRKTPLSDFDSVTVIEDNRDGESICFAFVDYLYDAQKSTQYKKTIADKNHQSKVNAIKKLNAIKNYMRKNITLGYRIFTLFGVILFSCIIFAMIGSLASTLTVMSIGMLGMFIGIGIVNKGRKAEYDEMILW